MRGMKSVWRWEPSPAVINNAVPLEAVALTRRMESRID